LVIYLLVATLIGVILAPFMLVTVPSGYVGVLWKRFGGGTVLDPRKLKDEGMRITLPWNRVFLYAEDVYSTKRAEVQIKIRERAETMLGEKMMVGSEGGDSEDLDNAPYRIPLYAMVNLINTLILGIELPSTVVTAINRKIEQYYISEEYKFRVAREIRESERKKIEAEGIHEFQQIVGQGISDSYLRWRGHRGDASARAVFQFQDRDRRQRQGRFADHPGQRRCTAIAATGIPGWKRRGCAKGVDNGPDDVFGANAS
jgi:prohibitin 2